MTFQSRIITVLRTAVQDAKQTMRQELIRTHNAMRLSHSLPGDENTTTLDQPSTVGKLWPTEARPDQPRATAPSNDFSNTAFRKPVRAFQEARRDHGDGPQKTPSVATTHSSQDVMRGVQDQARRDRQPGVGRRAPPARHSRRRLAPSPATPTDDTQMPPPVEYKRDAHPERTMTPIWSGSSPQPGRQPLSDLERSSNGSNAMVSAQENIDRDNVALRLGRCLQWRPSKRTREGW